VPGEGDSTVARWIVEGADRGSGDDRVERIDASTPVEAEQAAYRLGMIVSRVSPEPVVVATPQRDRSPRAIGLLGCVAIGRSAGLSSAVGVAAVTLGGATVIAVRIAEAFEPQQRRASVPIAWIRLADGDRLDHGVFLSEVRADPRGENKDGTYVRWRCTFANWSGLPREEIIRAVYLDGDGRAIAQSHAVEARLDQEATSFGGSHTMPKEVWQRVYRVAVEVASATVDETANVR
jgi:hypothetical protein